MKKRILCFFLVLCTLLSLFPVMAVTASADTLPRDESGTGASGASTGENVTKTDYDLLYVGADGSTTAGGGRLVGLYTAFDDAGASIDLTGGKWKNKMDVTGATDAVLRGAEFWSRNGDGSVGVTMDWNTWHFGVKKEAFGLTLPDSFLETEAYTVDTVARVKGVFGEDGRIFSASVPNYAFTLSSFRFGWFACTFFPSAHTSENQTLCCRWYFSSSTFNNGVHGDKEAIGGTHNGTWQDHGFSNYGGGVTEAAIPVAVDYAKTVPATGSEKYTVSYNGTVTFNRTLSAAEIATLSKTEADDLAPRLSLYNSVPTDVYAIRVYSAPLTEAENVTNSFVDLAAYFELDLSGYATLDPSCRSAVASAMSGYGYADDKAELEAKLTEVVNALRHEADTKDSLYVKKGLRLLLTAYQSNNTGYYQSEAGISWFNAAMADESATLKGGAWKLNENGGFTIIRSLADYQADATFGIYLPGAALPAESYTTELIFNPMGITTVNEDGELERYLDDHSPTGQWNEYGIVLGPLRCMHAVAAREVGKDAQFERRWVYRASGGLQDADWKYLWSDQMWGNRDEGVTVGFKDIETLVFEHEYSNGGSYYRILRNEFVHRTLSIDGKGYISPDKTGNMFQLMVGMPGTVYAVRVYDRVLSAAERNRNHAADIIYYYGLNTALLDSFLSKMDDDSDIFSAFGDMTFDMKKEEAQEEFDRRVVSIWLSYSGLGVRKDGKDGIRFYFDLNLGSIDDMLNIGYSLEIGTLVTLNQNASPVLSDDGYDYKVVAYDSTSGKNTGYFVDADTFALSVRYEGLERRAAITSVKVRGYVKLVSENGEELLFYSDPSTKDAETPPDSLFSVYNYMVGIEGLKKSNPELVSSMKEKLEGFYLNTTVYVQAGAANGGDGTKDAPYASFKDAFAKCKEIFAKVNVPTKVVLDVGDGVYVISDTVSLSKTEKPYPYTDFTILSKTGNATFTTTVGVDESLFKETGDNIWTCRLPKDASGAYPLFRYLYVDGRIADIAHSYDDSGIDENIGTAGFDRTFDGVYGNVLQLYQSGLLTADSQATMFYPASRTDLIATFNEYKNKFLALVAMDRIYKAGELTVDTPSPYEDETLSALFEDLKLQRLAWDDLAHQRKTDASPSRDHRFGRYEPKASTASAYVARFYALRDEIYGNWHMDSMEKYLPIVKQKAYTDEGGKLYDDMRHIAKFYIEEDMIGDWREEIAYGLTLLPAKREADIAAALAVYQPVLDALEESASRLTAKKNERDAAADAYANATDAADKAAKKAALDAIEESLVSLQGEHNKAQSRVNNAKKVYDTAVSRANEYTDPFMQYRFALQHLQIEMHINSQWCFNITHLDGIDYDDTFTSMDGTGYVACYLNRAEYSYFQLPGGYSQEGRHLYLSNGVKFLDEENEFYYDEKTGTVYYYTEKDPRKMTFEIPTNDYLFVLDHAEHVTLSGLTFTGVDDYYLTLHGISGSLGTEEVSLDISPDRSALLVRWCDDLVIENCNFAEIGGEAITARNRVENTLITGCTFEKIGSSAIRLGQHRLNYSNILYSETEGNEYVTISDNYMNGIAFEYHGSPAIIMPANKNVTITGNTIMNTAYSAMMIGWGFLSQTYNKGEHFNNYEVDISYNYIMSFMQEMGDGGAIYVTNGNAREDVGGYFNYIHHNYIVFTKDTGNGLGHMMCGLYFDGSSSHWHAYENVVVEQSYGAVPGEDEGFEEEDAEYLAKLRKRYSGTTFAYTQHIVDQETFHILYEDNYFLNVRATGEADRKKEIYKTYIVASRYIEERNTHYVNGIDIIPTNAEDIIYSAGCSSYPGDPYLLYDNNY